MATIADRPWHFIPVGILALLWHAGGALDYVLTKLDFAPYTSQVPGEWMVYFDAMPAWVTGAWALGVWAGLVGAVLLVMREHWAPLALAASFVGVAAATVWLTLISNPPMQQVVGSEFTVVMLAATAGAFFLWLYARWMRRRNVIV